MNKIINKSSNGFQVDGGQWFTCDKLKLLKKDKFQSLKIGDTIDSIRAVNGKDGKEYIIDFIVINHGDSVKAGNLIPSLNSKFIAPALSDSKELNILKSQCLNIVFNGMFEHGRYDITAKAHREEAIKLSRKLFEELKASRFGEW